MDYQAAIDFLYSLRLFGVKLGLDTACQLAALAGNPQDRLRFIHVAGTNGKGSTCAMLESVYRANGLRVGLFTSPHLVSFAERLQVNRQPIAEADVVRLVCEMQPWLARFPDETHPTFFEVVTVMALRYFAEQRCDLVIWETGLGGRLDATNIVTPLASVITNIGFEHQQWLGDTLDKIAAEKAGIIKPGVPVVTGARPGEGLEVIAAAARQQQAPLTGVDPTEADRPPLVDFPLPLPGHHQKLNAAVALAVVRVLSGPVPLRDGSLRAGLSGLYWPGRLQRVQTAGGQIILLDGAHNPAGAQALREALQNDFHAVKPSLVFGVFCDKDWGHMCPLLAPLAGRLALTPIKSDRSQDPTALVPVCHAANPNIPVQVCGSLDEALRLTQDDPFVVITGSLFLVGEAMERLHLAAAPPNNERILNEGSGPR